MDQLKLRILICFLELKEQDCNVTNLARLLGEEKYTISRIMGALEKSGYLDRTNRRRPFLTKAGEMEAKRYKERLDTTLEYLLYEGVSQADARKDAAFMALHCSEGTLKRIKEKKNYGRAKAMFGDGVAFDGAKMCKCWENGVYHLQFMLYTDAGRGHVSTWNREFDHPGLLEIKNGTGMVQLRISLAKRYAQFWYWDGEVYRSFERNGLILSFPAKFLEFVSVGKEQGRMLHGETKIKLEEQGETQILHLMVFIF